MSRMDFYANVAVVALFDLDEAVTSGDGALVVDVSGYNGQAAVVLLAREDASIANSKKLDVTVHNVASDSETTDADNLIATFAQLVGENDGSAVEKTTQILPLQLAEIPKLGSAETKVLKKNLQIKVVNTATWAGSIKVLLLTGMSRRSPENALP